MGKGYWSVLSFLAKYVEGDFENRDFREDALRDEFNNIIVDTCKAPDTGYWETGIRRDTWIIVEQYDSREEAVEGHKKWVKLMKENPDRELEDCLELGL